MISLITFSLAIVCYTIAELWQQGKLIWINPLKPFGFWGERSDKRKYKMSWYNDVDNFYDERPAPNNWYYNTFEIKYKEKFPLSATALVALTDGYHLMQHIMKPLLVLSIVFYEPIFFSRWLDFGAYGATFGLVFTITYKLLANSKRKN